MTDASATLLAEIREQPAAWRRVLAQEDELAALATRLGAAEPPLVRIAAHGTSDHAAAYATYALRLLCGWTAMRDSMSLPLYYDAPAAAPGELAIALSQSGETPDVVDWLRAARADGATALAITNGDGSALTQAADGAIVLRAGTEHSIAATKTYTATLAALALLGAHAHSPQRGATMARALADTADLAEDLLPRLERAVEPVADMLAGVDRLYAVARGVELATASEVALKLTEVAYLGAKALTATSMAHGPVAALDRTFPVWAVGADDATLPAVAEAVKRAREAGAPVIATGAAAPRLRDATFTLATPAAPDPLLSPLLSVLPGQLFARALAHAKGIDPGTPRHIRKVTSAA